MINDKEFKEASIKVKAIIDKLNLRDAIAVLATTQFYINSQAIR